jgi:hypothetical protein
VRYIQEGCLPHPLAPFLDTLGMARETEIVGAAEEHQPSLVATVKTSEAG